MHVGEFFMKTRREYPKRPLVGVGVVLRRDEEVLLVKRAFPPKAGYYSIPGGLVELGEKVRDAARREISEETGLDIKLEKIVDVIDNIVRDEDGKVKFHYVLVDFLARPAGGDLKSSSDVLEAKWVPFRDLPKYNLTNTAENLFRKLGFL